MKHHLQCAEQQASTCNVTKYCTCHVTWLSWLILLTYETSFTMPRAAWSDHDPNPNPIRTWSEPKLLISHPPVRRAYFSRFGDAFRIENNNISRSGYLPKFDRILRMPRTVTLQHHQIMCLPRKMTLMTHDWSSSHMKRHLQCAEHQVSSTNVTKYCACHVKWLAWVILMTYQTFFTLRRATGLTLQPHQILHLPHKMTLMIDARRIWNVIHNARSNRHHPNLTQYCASQEKLHSKILEKFAENGWSVIYIARPIRPWSDHYPNMIRAWNRKTELVRSRSLLPPWQRICFEKYNISRSGYLPKLHQILRLPRKVTLQHHQILCLPRKGDPATVPNSAPATKSDRSVTLVKCYLTELLLYWAVTWLTCYLTELWLDWTVTWLSCYFTELLLYWAVTLLTCYFSELLLYWAVTLLGCYFTEVLLDWTVTLLSCYLTELWLDWTVLLLSCYFTELLLYWAVTLLNCCWTELLLHWAVPWLTCYFTDLLLYWAVTLLNCYFTGLLLYWTVTLLSCYFTGLLLYWTVTWLSCYFTELLLYWVVTLLTCYFTDLLVYWAVTLLRCYFTELLFYWAVTLLDPLHF